MKTINLTQNKQAIVDDEDWEQLAAFTWCYCGGYAIRNRARKDGAGFIHMHRVVLGLLPRERGGLQVDHIDGNRLNNQKANLRLATNQQNNANKQKANKATYSRFKGVTRKAGRDCWVVQIGIRGLDNKPHSVHVGYFKTEETAACAYNSIAQEWFGDYAVLNVVPHV